MVGDVKSLPAPVGGWNARESIADMPEKDAAQMDDMFPNTTDVMLRKGYSQFATGIAGVVETLAAYSSATKSELFAVAQNAIYDVTAGGAVGAPVVTGLTNARWQHVNFGVPGADQWLCMVNGVDKFYAYNGTTWTAIDSTSTPGITGVNTTDLIHINVFKRRLWFVQRNTSKVWYLPVDSIGGAAQSIDMGALFTSGGSLMAMGTWTLDAGEGLDDHAIFLSSKGQIAVYKGTDPASADTWSLIGVYDVGSPIGRRCFMKFGGDLLVITRDGVLPLAKALLSSRVTPHVAITDKIQSAVADSVANYGGNFGWQLVQYPNANMLLLNVPLASNLHHQYVMNTITGAWCRFKGGWDASCWEVYDDEIYFGANGFVGHAWNTNADNGSNITGDVIPAFSYFGNRAQEKRWTMARPIIQADGVPAVLLGINTDFDTTTPVGTPTLTPTTVGLWDSAIWDQDVWGGFQIQKNWQTVSGLGYAASLHMVVTSRNYTVKWQATDFVFERGGVL
jgi:hypothetical protein